jgi:hypothetical protein
MWHIYKHTPQPPATSASTASAQLSFLYTANLASSVNLRAADRLGVFFLWVYKMSTSERINNAALSQPPLLIAPLYTEREAESSGHRKQRCGSLVAL